MDQRPVLIATTCVCGNLGDVDEIGFKNGHRVGTCKRCGVTRTLTRYHTYDTQYTEGDQYHVAQQQQDGHVPYTERYEADYQLAALQRIPKLLGLFRSLDVGCSNGAFLEAMAARGFQAVGIEPNPGMAEWAAWRSGRPVYTSWAALPADLRCFDVITYHDVFEHVVDPRAELSQIWRHLYFGGLLVLDVPDADTATDMTWKHWRPEQHLWHWTESTLATLLEDDDVEGFGVEAVDKPIPGKLVVYARKLTHA